MACCCECFIDGDLDGGEFGVGHADEVEEVEGAVYEGDVEVCRAVLLLDGCILTSSVIGAYPFPSASPSLAPRLLLSLLPPAIALVLVWTPLWYMFRRLVLTSFQLN